MTDDAELLRRYVESHSNADFTEFVGRHFSFVYHAALRRTGGRADLAEDVTQYVFTAVARQASALCDHRVLAGWLYTTTRHAANSILRAERRRSAREQEANLMSDTPSPHGDPQWNRVRQELDSVMDQLPDRDREAILLRFFHGQPFAQIGTAFGLSEEAARKRVARALERLRECLVKRGITSTSAALGAMLSGEAALAAPANMANAVAGAALVQAGNAGFPAVGSILQLMSTKTTLGIAGTIGLAGMLVITAIGVVVHYNREARQAEAAVAFAQRDHRSQAALLEKLRRDADKADTGVAEAQSALDQLRVAAQARAPGNAPAPAAAPARDPLADGKKLLATTGPARAAFTDMIKNVARRNNAHFYRLANFTPAQIEEYGNRAAAYGLETLTISETGSWATKHRLPDNLMRLYYGDEIAQKFSDYGRMWNAYYVATEVAQAATYAAQPISDDQVDRIAHAVANNNDDYRSGKSVSFATMNSVGHWDAVMTEAKTVLSPEQWKAAEDVLVRYLWGQSLEQARQAMMAAASAKPKS